MAPADKTISLGIVVPCHNEQSTIPQFLSEMNTVATSVKETFDVELIFCFVDDGSTDDTLEVMRSAAQEQSNVRYISLSRNFGKEAALYAGLDAAVHFSDILCVMDVDLQDPPSLLPQMIEPVLDGSFDRVAARRVSRTGEPPIRSFFARQFYKIMRSMTNLDLRDGARDYSVMSKRFVQAVLDCHEYNRFSKGLFGWVGFPTSWVSYENTERISGESSWSFSSLFAYAVDGIIAFTIKPLHTVSIAGTVLSLIAIIFTFFVFIRAIFFGDPVAGWPSLMAVLLLVSGFLLFALGIIGEYLSKIYLEIKQRPIYLVKEKNFCYPGENTNQ